MDQYRDSIFKSKHSRNSSIHDTLKSKSNQYPSEVQINPPQTKNRLRNAEDKLVDSQIRRGEFSNLKSNKQDDYRNQQNYSKYEIRDQKKNNASLYEENQYKSKFPTREGKPVYQPRDQRRDTRDPIQKKIQQRQPKRELRQSYDDQRRKNPLEKKQSNISSKYQDLKQQQYSQQFTKNEEASTKRDPYVDKQLNDKLTSINKLNSKIAQRLRNMEQRFQLNR